MSPAKILIVDDEPSIHKVIAAYLKVEGYDLQSAFDGPGGLAAVKTFNPDVIILDIMLPGMDGIQVLTSLRQFSDAYVIMLTARTEETDKIVGLTVGADDYLTKPFSTRELVARIKAALRRIQGSTLPASQQPELLFAHVRISPAERRVWLDGTNVELTAIEFDMLFALAINHGIVLSRSQIMEKVWGYAYYGDTRVVDVHMGHIRQKLGSDRFIETIRGVGYRFEDKESK